VLADPSGATFHFRAYCPRMLLWRIWPAVLSMVMVSKGSEPPLYIPSTK
jgi:hypothetical protein